MKARLLLSAPLLLLATGAVPPAAFTSLPHRGALVAAWSMDEGAGSLARDSGSSGLDALVRDGTWAPGVSGTALEFDGTGGHVAVIGGAPSELTDLGEGSISLWFRFDDVPGIDTIHPLFYVGDGIGGPGNSELIIEIGHFGVETTIYCTVVVDDEQIPQCFNSIQDLVPGELYHFVVVVDEQPGLGPNRGRNTGYLNGRELWDREYRYGSANKAFFLNDVADAQVAWFGRGILSQVAKPQHLNGMVDEVMVWDEPLSADQIFAYYRGSLSRMQERFAR